MYDYVFFEISGFCNAKCPWCVNRRGNLKQYNSRVIPPKEFEKAIDYMIEESLIHDRSLLNLYNFGEPLMHPCLNEILHILADRNLCYTISTNAFNYTDLDEKSVKNLKKFFISIPGFSQKSYDKIHGFDIKKILVNVDRWISHFREKIQIQYHVYQFNLDEIGAASAYFKQKGVNFFPYLAYINDYQLAKSYLDRTLPQKMLDKALKELILNHVEEQLMQIPGSYTCPQHSILTIDEYCNVLTCCLLSKADPDYSIGSLFALSKEDIEEKKVNQRICIECIQMGISTWVNSVSRPDFIKKFEYIPYP